MGVVYTLTSSAAAHNLHETAELFFFISGIGLFILAVPGLYMQISTRSTSKGKHKLRQNRLRLSTRARQATAYESLYEKTLSVAVTNGLSIITESSNDYAIYPENIKFLSHNTPRSE